MEAVKVITRVRPLSQRDMDMHNKSIVTVDKNSREVLVAGANGKDGELRRFAYDGVYGPQDTTASIFTESIVDLLDGALNGYNCTVFAYGQTGSGKTYTMHGQEQTGAEEGIVFRAIDYIFGQMDQQADGCRSLVYCSFLEIYMEEFRDLLKPGHHPRSTPTAGNPVYHCMKLKIGRRMSKKGLCARQQAATKMNTDSSRSHAIFTITVEVSRLVNGVSHITMAKVNFVDLAGSERQAKADAIRDRQNEAIRINLSLSTLGRVIQALTDGKSTHIPYRDSKLTRLLETSLGGNAKTVMISCISPVDDNREESLSTLSYASRAKAIRNQPVVNTDPQTALIRQYLDHIRRLENQIARIPVNDEERQREIAAIKEEHHEAMRRLEKEQEATLERFARQMREANEEEKQRLVRQKEEELDRIYKEVLQREREEWKRLEMEKVEELKRMEGKLTKAAEEEKRRIQMEFAQEMKRFKEETEANVQSQKLELEAQQRRDLDMYRKTLQEQTDQQRDDSIDQAKNHFDKELQTKLAELEERHKGQVEEIRCQLKAQYTADLKKYQDEKEAQIQRLHEENISKTRQLLDELLNKQERELQRLMENHGKLKERLEKEQNVNFQKRISSLEQQNKQEHAVMEKRYIKRIEELRKGHEREVENLRLESTDNQAKVVKKLEILHLKEITDLSNGHVEEVERLKNGHVLQIESIYLENEAKLASVKRYSAENLQKLENEHRNRIEQAKDLLTREYERKIETLNAELEEQRVQNSNRETEYTNEIAELRSDYQQEISALQRANKDCKQQILRLESDLIKLEKEKVKGSQQSVQCEQLQKELQTSQELLADQRQKVAEMEDEIQKLREERYFALDGKAFVEQQMRELNKVRTMEIPREGKNGMLSAMESRNLRTPHGRVPSGNGGSGMLQLSVSGRKLADRSLVCHSRASAASVDSPKPDRIAAPKRPTSARREALIKAVAGINAESLLQAAHHEYEEQLNECIQHIHDKETEIDCLQNRLHEESRHTQKELDGIQHENLKHQQLAQLYRQIVNTVLPHLPECNYRNLHDVVQAATWNDIAGKWQLPAVEVAVSGRCDISLDLRPVSRRSGRSSSLVRQTAHGDLDEEVVTGRGSAFEFDPCPSVQLPRPLSCRRRISVARTPVRGYMQPLRSMIIE
ncbi:osmotic avoidance abnormal protein 3-like [Paramacrobiotus metropolitanus]|uniref:osmotic avoidance abnormal protein 3-like n=1 Tax=Paramacrobiotus metropolitanus TaxID=2943436 RepID=UPI0024458CA7|nr:osmotic avoidance abnormal protein 3-like [Paramacrobiotus metropolitanus]